MNQNPRKSARNWLFLRALPTILFAASLALTNVLEAGDTSLQIAPARALPNYVKTNLATGTIEKGLFPTLGVGDFDENGRLDVAVLVGGGFPNSLPLGVTVYLQNNDGTLRKKVEYELPTLNYTWDFILGDFNGDGHLDIVADDIGNDLIILFGNGDGTFRDPQFMGLSAPGFPVAVDINNDKHLDIIAGSLAGTVGVFLGAGDGTFSERTTLDSAVNAVPPRRGQIMVGDLDRDGKLDVAVASPQNLTTRVGTLDVFLAKGDGTFEDPIRNEDVAAWRSVLADFNGDGLPDFAGNRYSPEQIDVWLGQGDGHFRKDKSLSMSGVRPAILKSNDLNSDGIPDLLCAAESADGFPAAVLSIFLGKGDGTFPTRRSFSPAPDAMVFNVGPQLNDFDGDGRTDIISVGGSSSLDNSLAVAFNKEITVDSRNGLLLNIQNTVIAPGPLLLEATTDFMNWIPLATNSSPSTNWPINDTTVGFRRFYRTRGTQ